MVKEFERNATTSVAVLVDADETSVSGDDEMSNLEYQIRAAASICHYCAGLYCELAFAAGGSRILLQPPRPAPEVQHDVLYSLASLRPGRVPVSEAAYALAQLLPRGTVVFCLSLSVNKAMREAMETLMEKGLQVRWYCADRETFQTTKRKGSSVKTEIAERALANSVVTVAQLRPDMHLEEALVPY
jgi:uncharacterized protein (DUF58 family)